MNKLNLVNGVDVQTLTIHEHDDYFDSVDKFKAENKDKDYRVFHQQFDSDSGFWTDEVFNVYADNETEAHNSFLYQMRLYKTAFRNERVVK